MSTVVNLFVKPRESIYLLTLFDQTSKSILCSFPERSGWLTYRLPDGSVPRIYASRHFARLRSRSYILFAGSVISSRKFDHMGLRVETKCTYFLDWNESIQVWDDHYWCMCKFPPGAFSSCWKKYMYRIQIDDSNINTFKVMGISVI